MSKRTSELSVYIAGSRCGTISENAHGALSFTYDTSYDGVPLSLSMPLGLAPYGDRIVRPYLMGLLPDNEGTRASIGAPFGVSGDNPFRLLELIGRDCPGAVQILPCGQSPAEQATDELVALSDEALEMKLSAVRDNAASAWTNGLPLTEGHWSLGGCQAKLALRLQDGAWFECAGNAATTHIVKPGVAGFEHQALCEYLSMKVASAIRLPAARVDFRMFGKEPAIIIERYDRVRREDGGVGRIHQEDVCQALSVSPTAKYAEQGGPTTPQVIDLLWKTGANARENVYRFILYLFFNYLVGATDAHAKNHSIVFAGKDDVRLAPLYDVASIAPYRSLRPTRRKPLRMALSIGGENRFGMVGREHVEKLVRTNSLESLGLDGDFLCGRFATMAAMVPDAVAREVDDARRRKFDGIDTLAAPFVAEIEANCARTLELLG